MAVSYGLLLKNQRGSALMLSLVAMVFLGLIGATFLFLTATEVKMAAAHRDGIAAQALAEAGAKRGLVELANDTTWPGVANQSEGQGVTQGKYSVSWANSGGDIIVTSIGVVNNESRQVKLRLTGSGSFGIFGATRVVIFNWNSLTITGGTVVASNNAVEAEHGSPGDQANPNITPDLNLPSFSADAFKSNMLTIPSGKNVNASFNLEDGKKYYIEGNIDIDSLTFTGNGQVYVNGSITLEKDLNLSGNTLFLYTVGDIEAKNNLTVDRGLIIATGNVTMKNAPKVVGAVYSGGTLQLKNAATLTYDGDAVDNYITPLGGSMTYKIKSWAKQ